LAFILRQAQHERWQKFELTVRPELVEGWTL